MSNLETLLNAWLNDGEVPAGFQPETRIEEYLVAILEGVDDSVTPQSRADVLLDAIAAKYAGYAAGIADLEDELGVTAVPPTPQQLATLQAQVNEWHLQSLADKGITPEEDNTFQILAAYEQNWPSGGGLRDELLAGLPHNQNIVAWFDSREGVSSTSWKNLINANDMALFDPTVTDDGDVRVDGTETSYGLYKRKSDTDNATIYSAFTRYFVLRKAPNTGYVGDWQTIVGDENSNTYVRATLAASRNGEIWYTRPDQKVTGTTYDDWHVISVRYTNDGTSVYGHGYLYADGVKATETGSSYAPQGWSSGLFFSRGESWYHEYPKGAIEIRAFLDFDVCHTEEEMLANTAWLRQHYFGIPSLSAVVSPFNSFIQEYIGG